MIRRLRESTFRRFIPAKEAKLGPIKYPSNHKPGMEVPIGGSSCSSCKYLGEDKKTCINQYFILWNGSKLLPAPADKYCSDWYEPKGKK
jgi:hypothetical protein